MNFILSAFCHGQYLKEPIFTGYETLLLGNLIPI
uniref:Uncharacterized protein n=1 Tax=Anguilla anguilla TaxID=7936 RepID=A0A0E9QW10_ANGAN